MKAPKYLSNHPAVADIDMDMYGASGGAYRWNILLKDGWQFESGRNAGGSTLSGNNKADFEYANPVKVK